MKGENPMDYRAVSMRPFLLTFIVMAFFSGWLRADVYEEKISGIKFPETIGAYKKGKATPYEAESGKAGVAVEYRSNDAEVTIFVRMLGGDAGKTSEYFLQQSLAGVKEFEAQGKYSNVKIYEPSPDSESPGWKSAAFTSSATNRFLVSFICCKVASNYMVKIRASTGNPKNEALQSYLKNLQAIVDKAPKRP
jgi:hypothetical protein